MRAQENRPRSHMHGSPATGSASRVWSTTEPQQLTESSFWSLLRNEIPAIVVPDFASCEECAGLAISAEAHGFSTYRDVSPPIDRIGVTVFEHDGTDHGMYFREAAVAGVVQRAIFADAFDPVQRFIRILRDQAHVAADVAIHPTFGRYYSGLIRRIEKGTLVHIDYAPTEHPSWGVVSEVEAQFSWNLYIELDAIAPGDTRIFERVWQPGDESLKIVGTYGYRRDIVSASRCVTFRPSLGAVYILNTRNYHEVEPSRGRRTTVGSGGGALRNRQIVLWS